jgi:hypothetical protein
MSDADGVTFTRQHVAMTNPDGISYFYRLALFSHPLQRMHQFGMERVDASAPQYQVGW